MKRRLFAGLISILVVSTMFLSACKPNSEVQSPSDTSSQTGAATSTPKERQKITVAIYDRGNIPASEGAITDNRWTKWVSENGPVDVEYVAIPRNSSGEKYNALFASNSAPDLIQEFSVANMNTFYSNKLLMPLNDVIDSTSVEYKAILDKYPVLKDFLTKPDGKMYTFGVINSASTNHYLIVRSDWMKNVGLEAPKTPEEFIALCEAFTKGDPDKNGKNDTIALSLSPVTGNVINAMFGGMGSWDWEWDITATGTIYNWDSAFEAMNFKKTLFDKGCVDKDYATDTDGAKATQDFLNGKLGILGLNGGKNATLNTLKTLVQNSPDADFVAIGLPTTKFGSFSPAGGGFLQSNGAINAKCKNPEAVMEYIDFLNRKETILQIKYGGDEYSQINPATGGFVPKDADKFKTEVSYIGDIHMTASKILDPYNDILPFDPSDPIQKRAMDIVKNADRIYLNPEITHIQLTNYPPLTTELTVIKASIGTQIDDIYTKAILSGKDYSAEKALADAQKIFTESGGQQLTDFYDKFFKENPKLVLKDSSLKDMMPAYLK